VYTAARVSKRAQDTRLLALSVALASLTGCNLEVPSPSYLRQTTLIAVVVEVVELGPINPGRAATPSPAPIAEPMPHDRVVFDAYVVDAAGVRVPAAQLDSLWFQCGAFDCGEAIIDPSSGLFDVDCEDLDGTGELGQLANLDAVCRLGRGDGRFEFELAEIGQILVEQRVAQFYGVIAWEGRSADDCWAARRSRDRPLDRCGFIQRSVKIGPSWAMLVYAELVLGLVSPIPLAQIPLGVLTQQANRVPLPSFEVLVDDVVIGRWPNQDRFTVAAGDRVEIEPKDDLVSQFFQSYFVGRPLDEAGSQWLFLPAAEQTGERVFSSGAIVVLDHDPFGAGVLFPTRWELVVDEYATPGVSRVVLHYFDDRFGEGVATLEFEVGSG
jgi:hypothetical protein